MPRIPESAVTVGLPSVSSQPIREATLIGQAATGFAENLTNISAKLAEAERADELIQKSAAMEGSLVDLQLSIEQDPNLGTVASASQAFEDGAAQIFSEFGQSESPTVSHALEKQFLQSRLQSGVSVKRTGYKRQSDASVAGLDTATENFERAYAAAPDDQKRAEIRARHALLTNLNLFISDQEKGDRIRDFQTDTDTARVRGLIDSGQFGSAEELLASDQLVGLDPNEHLALTRTLEITKTGAETDLRRDLKAVEDSKIHDILRRFHDRDDPNGVPSVMEILDANLPRTVSEHFIELSEASANGADLNTINPNVYNYLYNRVHDTTRVDQITDFNQILPWVGKGISPERAELLRTDINSLLDPQIKADNAVWNEFLNMAEGLIDRSTFMGRDGVGGDKYFQFLLVAQEARAKGEKEGKSIQELVNKRSPHYIGQIIPQYMRTDIEVSQDMIESQLGLSRVEVAPPLAVPTYEDGEGMESWMKRRDNP